MDEPAKSLRGIVGARLVLARGGAIALARGGSSSPGVGPGHCNNNE